MANPENTVRHTADNLQKHGVNFETAQYAFIDPKRVIAEELAHSKKEKGQKYI